MFLSSQELHQKIAGHEIGIEPFDENLLKGVTYKFTLGSKVSVVKKRDSVNSLMGSELAEVEIPVVGYPLKPGELVVLYSKEKLTLNGKFVCLLSTKMSIAHMGLDINQGSFLCEPDTDNVIAFETVNHGPSTIVLFPGIEIAKGIFASIGS